MLCCGYTLTDLPISIRLTSLALWQSNDCPSASKATLMNMDKYFMWIHYERLHNHNKAKHNKTVCIFLGIYCMCHKQANSFWEFSRQICSWLCDEMSTGNHFLDYFPLSIPISVFSTSGFLMFYCRYDICYATGRETMYIILGMYWIQPVEEDSPNRMHVYINKMPEPDCYNWNYSVDTPEKKDNIISAFSRVFVFVRTF